ncbi:MAG: peroxiredoxin [Dehalococcoidia bacterium]
MLKTGTRAPDFTGRLDDGSTFELAKFRGEKNIVLYFYPKDFTPGCTAQACNFRDNYSEISQYDAIIVGVSSDDEDSHTSFKEKHELPFRLLADPGKQVHRMYEAVGLIPWMTPRMTYVIDKQGVIRAAIRHDFRVKEHVPEVISALKQIAPK